MRPGRVLAVTRRDLAIEFAGRRGALLPLIASFILLPMASAPNEDLTAAYALHAVDGEVPEDILSLPEIEVRKSPATVTFVAPSEATNGQWVLSGQRIARPLRDAMDARETAVRVETMDPRPFSLPNRSLFLALVAASILTGALSQSIPGERSQGSLETLLTASITRTELIVGKWLAWGGFGATAGMVAALVSVALGRQEAGLWLLPLPWVALGTVAFGFYMVRRAADVVGGATVALRMLPASLTLLALLAWYLGDTDPYLGASVPLGGALLAAGATWPGAGPTLWATTVTAAATGLCLVATARDLDPAPGARNDAGLSGALLTGMLALLAWWTPVLGSLLWTAGGSPERTESIPQEAGVMAGGLGLATLVAMRLARDRRPADDSGWTRPPTLALGATILAGLGLSLTAPVSGLVPLPEDPVWVHLRLRLAGALNPAWAGMPAFLLAVAAQEALFRGWIRRQAGEVAQVVLFAIVCTPLDPVRGILVALLLGRLVHVSQGSILTAIAARVIWGLFGAADLGLSPLTALVASGMVLAAIWWPTRSRPDPWAATGP